MIERRGLTWMRGNPGFNFVRQHIALPTEEIIAKAAQLGMVMSPRARITRDVQPSPPSVPRCLRGARCRSRTCDLWLRRAHTPPRSPRTSAVSAGIAWMELVPVGRCCALCASNLHRVRPMHRRSGSPWRRCLDPASASVFLGVACVYPIAPAPTGLVNQAEPTPAQRPPHRYRSCLAAALMTG